MGCNFSSSSTSPESGLIDQKMADEKEQENRRTKLLLLGMGDVGKTTFYRQFKFLYGGGFDDHERRHLAQHIGQQCIQQMKRLSKECHRLAEKGNHDFQFSPEASEAYKKLMDLRFQNLNEEIAEWIGILWKDSSIRRGFALGSKMGVAASSGYFWDRIDQVWKTDFLPDDQECVKLRSSTVGVVHFEFEDPHSEIDPPQTIEIIDVGGQRNERKKWVTVFDDCTAIIWVASLSAYCEVLYENSKVAAMQEQVDLFGETVNLDCFSCTPVILFLNKSDLFHENLKEHPLNECFPEYNGPNQFDHAAKFIANVFRKVDTYNDKRMFYAHTTCALDQSRVNTIFTEVSLSVIWKNSEKIGVF